MANADSLREAQQRLAWIAYIRASSDDVLRSAINIAGAAAIARCGTAVKGGIVTCAICCTQDTREVLVGGNKLLPAASSDGCYRDLRTDTIATKS